MKSEKRRRILALGAALWMGAALLLGGCSVPAGESPVSEPAKSAQGGAPNDNPGMGELPAGEINLWGNSTGNISNGGIAAKQGDWIFYAGSDGIYRMKSDGSGVAKISDDDAKFINVIGEWIYFYDEGKAYRIKTNGNEKTDVCEINALLNLQMLVIGDYIYTTAVESNGKWMFRSKKFDGTDLLKKEIEYARDVLIGDGVVFVQTEGNNKIYVCGLGDTDICITEKLKGDGFYIIAVDDKFVYVRQMYDSQMLYRISFDGGVSDELPWGKGRGIRDAVISDGWLYFANSEDNDAIYKIRPYGGEETKVVNDSADDINVVGDWIFYKCTDDSEWYRIRTDGTGRTPLE